MKKYYKFVWDYCNESCDDGGKYMGCQYGVLYASSNNKIFKLAAQCKKICDDKDINGDTINGFYGSYTNIYACSMILNNRVELSRKEYYICKKHAMMVSFCADSGGTCVRTPSITNLIKNIEYEIQDTYIKLKLFLNIKDICMYDTRCI